MYKDYDESFSDFDNLSSPFAERDFSFPEFNFYLQGHERSMEITIDAEYERSYPSSQPVYADYEDLKPHSKFQSECKPQKKQASLTAKEKKSPFIFSPFSSFVATELTVRNLNGALGH